MLVFGGTTVILKIKNNGMFIFTGLLSFAVIAIIAAVLYAHFFNKILIDDEGFYFKICIGENGFFFQSNPFNGKYYNYKDILSCKEELKRIRHSVGYGDPVTYRYFFYFTDRNGRTQKILFEKSLFEREFEALKNRIDKNFSSD